MPVVYCNESIADIRECLRGGKRSMFVADIESDVGFNIDRVPSCGFNISLVCELRPVSHPGGALAIMLEDENSHLGQHYL